MSETTLAHLEMYTLFVKMSDHVNDMIEMVRSGDQIINRKSYQPELMRIINKSEKAIEILSIKFFEYRKSGKKFHGKNKDELEKAYEDLVTSFYDFLVFYQKNKLKLPNQE